ncbi:MULTISPECIES: hypothetical protein [Chryseobacterium]|jgi:hypothetical protein|uniref:Uncharacterized protein n=1 Tax=Chryseobacterium salviniae TaxID=3101750 RepID=A0ABU6HNI0_9FLAO|nr:MULTISPECIES: hypothetical protein [unclassified Chryseobacterium]MEC3874274.1 hypothetical protein [Chryseobacterium sp. T9W2-O]
MNYIKETLKKETSSFEELIECFEKIKTNGEVVVIKFDGERNENAYTVFISFPNNKREMIRIDDNDLKNALIKVLNIYLESPKEN